MEYSERTKKAVLRVAMITSFLTTSMSSALDPSIPDISSEFNINAGHVGWIITVYTLVVAALCVPMGKLADVKGHGRMLRAGLALFCATSLVSCLAANMPMLIAARALQGCAAAMIFANNNTILLNVHPNSERGKVLGLSTSATYIGLSVGPVAGGIIDHNFGWRYIFVFSGCVALVAVVMAFRNKVDDAGPACSRNNKNDSNGIRDAGAPNGAAEYGSYVDTANSLGEDMPDGAAVPLASKADILGTVLFVPMVVLMLYGLSLVGSTQAAYILLAISAVCLLLFIATENRAELPIINIKMFAEDRQFTCSNIAALLNYGATFAISYLMSIYLQMVLGFSSQTAGFVLVTMPIFQAMLSPKMGALSDRIAPYKLASAGMLCCVVTLVLFAITLPAESIVCVVGALALGGTGFALFSSPNTNAIMSRVPQRDRGQGMAIVSTMRTVGQSVSMCIVTILVNLRLGEKTLQEVPADVLIATIRLIFAVFAVICVAGTIISAVRAVDDKQVK